MLSNSFSRVINHAREEYLYVYSVYVLEASTSNRLTHFYPPFNLLALVIFRPLRLFLPSDGRIRAARILLLRATHLPIVGAIMLYELVRGKVARDEYCGFQGPRHDASGSTTTNTTTTTKSTTTATTVSQRKTSRTRTRPASSPTSPYALNQHQYQQLQPARPQSMGMGMFEPLILPSSRLVPMAADNNNNNNIINNNNDAANDDVDAPTDVDVQIAELSSKIDRLTEIILSMRREREESQHTEPVT